MIHRGLGQRRWVALRWLLVASQLATILITWPLWQVHNSPPLLPAIAIGQAPLAWPLVVSLLVVLFRPALGVALHAGLLVIAMLMDQTRIQPEIISQALLLFATLDRAAGRMIGRAHLLTMWFYAGLHKLLSPAYFRGFHRLITSEFPGLSHSEAFQQMAVAIAAVLALYEIALAALAWFTRTRRIAASAAVAMHLGIVVLIGPLGNAPNHAVVPWNLALAASAALFIGHWRESSHEAIRRQSRPTKIVLAGLAIYPVGFYLGWVDAYAAHCLYSRNTYQATMQPADGEAYSVTHRSFRRFQAPTPPEPRLFIAYYRAVARPGDLMAITDQGPHWKRREAKQYVLTTDGEIRDGRRHGPWTHRFDDGAVASAGRYEGGVRVGRWTFRHPNGTLAGVGQFDAGQRAGRWKYWDETGRPVSESLSSE